MKLKSVLRSLQSAAPFIRPLKFGAYNYGTRFLGRPMEPEFRLLSSLRPTSLALDIGGNWGQSIYSLKRTAKPGRIVSFEPNPALVGRLEQHFANDTSVEIRKYALSNSAGEFNLYIPRYKNYYYDGLASLDYDEVVNWFKHGRLAWFNPMDLHIDTVVVKTFTLDSLNLSPEIIKMDVQGSEEMVIEGGISTFEKFQPFTIIECPTLNIVNILSNIGLYAYFYNEGKLKDWKDHGTNVVFMTDDHRKRLSL